MQKSVYNKSFLSYAEQIDLLKSRGLSFRDEVKALSILYKYLKLDKYKQEIAQFFCLSDVAFESWLHSLVYARNICAHHSRLWNRQMRISPLPLKTHKNIWLDNKQVSNNRIYFVLSMIIYLLNIINPGHSFKQKLGVLFSKYPCIDKSTMGFPINWQKEPLWTIKENSHSS